MKNDLVCLLDADFIKYLVSYDIERMFKKGLSPDAVLPYSTIADLTEKRIEAIKKVTQSRTKEYIFLFSGKTRDNYRALIACEKKYKGTRVYNEKYPKEGKYRSLVEVYIEDNYHYHKEFDLEADDLCVMAHSEGTYIYSNDKDLKMSPGLHYDIKEKKFIFTSKAVGFKILLAQTITGDSVDNIGGVHGIGKVGAKRIIENSANESEMITNTIDAFTSKYGNKEGLDRFAEMYGLVNLKTNRGKWTNEKYKSFFDKVENLKQDKSEDRKILDLFN